MDSEFLTETMFKKLIGGSVALLAVPVAAATLKDNTPKDPLKCRPSELPIYPSMDTEKSVNTSPTSTESNSMIRSSIEGGVQVVREACCDCVNTLKDKKKPIDEFVNTGVGHSQCKWTRFEIGLDQNLNFLSRYFRQLFSII